MREQPGEHGFRERPLAGFRAVEKCQRPERHHGHGQGGERKIAPARVEYQAERGLRGNERRHDQRDAQHVGHEKRRQALGRPQHFKKRRKPAPRHQGVGGQQRRRHCRRQQKTLNQPTAGPVAFVKHLVGAHAQQDSADGRGHGDREPRCQWRRRRPALQRDQGDGEDADAKQQPACHLQLPERIVADGHPGRIFQLAFGPVEQPPIAAYRSFPAALPRLVIGLEKIDAKIVLPRPLENLRK